MTRTKDPSGGGGLRPDCFPGRPGRLPSLLLLVFTAACGRDLEIEQPRPLYGEPPIEYPITLWDRGVEGETILRVRVSDTGVVDSVEVLQSSGYHELDSAAVKGAKALRFSPGRRNGKRIEVWAQVPVHFSRRPQEEDQEEDPQQLQEEARASVREVVRGIPAPR